MFVVTTTNPKCGTKFWLKGTTWSFSEDRGDKFPTHAAAQTALIKSMKFNQPWAAKRAVIKQMAATVS